MDGNGVKSIDKELHRWGDNLIRALSFTNNFDTIQSPSSEAQAETSAIVNDKNPVISSPVVKEVKVASDTPPLWLSDPFQPLIGIFGIKSMSAISAIGPTLVKIICPCISAAFPCLYISLLVAFSVLL